MCLNHLHTGILEASADLYADGHYASAIFEAFKAVEERVRGLTDLELIGVNLMNHAFAGDPPQLTLNALDGHVARDEQRGFHQIFAGAMQGIRNEKAHTVVDQHDPARTLDYLGLASLLMRRLDDAERVRREN